MCICHHVEGGGQGSGITAVLPCHACRASGTIKNKTVKNINRSVTAVQGKLDRATFDKVKAATSPDPHHSIGVEVGVGVRSAGGPSCLVPLVCFAALSFCNVGVGSTGGPSCLVALMCCAALALCRPATRAHCCLPAQPALVPLAPCGAMVWGMSPVGSVDLTCNPIQSR